MIKKWEKVAPICENCKKQNEWDAFVENLQTGDKYFVCSCGNEQDQK